MRTHSVSDADDEPDDTRGNRLPADDDHLSSEEHRRMIERATEKAFPGHSHNPATHYDPDVDDE